MLIGTVFLAGLVILLAALLVIGNRFLPPESEPIVDQLEQLLPRIQCGQCGYAGCRAYAEAIASSSVPINRCPPGGTETIRQLASIMGLPTKKLREDLGQASLDQVAWIDENLCIGCNLCARVCPVDAIAGVPQMMHTVIAIHCTGCELCLPPCPVDCIELAPRND